VTALLNVSAQSGRAPEPAEIGGALRVYKAGDYDAGIARIRALRLSSEQAEAVAKDFRKLLRTEPANIAAAFALEVAAVLFEIDRVPAYEVLEVGCDRLGRARGEWEHDWHRAAVSLLLGPPPVNEGRRETTRFGQVLKGRQDGDLPVSRWWASPDSHFRHARDRFPDDMDLQFAWGLTSEHFVYRHRRQSGIALAYTPRAFLGQNSTYFPPQLEPATRAYREILESSAAHLHGDAALHLGTMLQYALQPDAAIAMWKRVPTLTPNRDHHYLARSFAGRLHWQRGEIAEALAAFQEALSIRPRTQSTVIPAASVLFLLNERGKAAALVEDLMSAPRDTSDPWWSYLRGPFDRWPERLRAVRQGQSS
jgi:tetratricopeptide (TPR) repeat protein